MLCAHDMSCVCLYHSYVYTVIISTEYNVIVFFLPMFLSMHKVGVCILYIYTIYHVYTYVYICSLILLFLHTYIPVYV